IALGQELPAVFDNIEMLLGSCLRLHFLEIAKDGILVDFPPVVALYLKAHIGRVGGLEAIKCYSTRHCRIERTRISDFVLEVDFIHVCPPTLPVIPGMIEFEFVPPFRWEGSAGMMVDVKPKFYFRIRSGERFVFGCNE